MAVLSCEQFVEAIVKSGLLEQSDLDGVLREFRLSPKSKSDSPKELALFLISRSLLTKYQAKRLLAGNTAGFLLGGCRILDRLGEGGMGVVYLAEQTRLRRKVAVKVLPFRRADDEVTRRFYREARAAAKLKHPNIVQVFDVDRDGDTHFILMEYVNGKNLSEIIKARGCIPPGESVEIIRQIADGLRHAHDNGVVHRDIKPSNIVMEGSVAKILDLGLARQTTDEQLTSDRMVLGTLDYMSPEQCEDSSGVDNRSDLYSLGCTWFHMLVGQAPFADRPASGKLLGHVAGQIPDISRLIPELPLPFREILQKMTARAKESRYQNAAEFLEAIRSIDIQFSSRTAPLQLVSESNSTAVTLPNTVYSAETRGSGSSDLELEERSVNHQTLIHSPAQNNIISVAFLIPVMAALVLGGIYIGVKLLSHRLPQSETIVIDVPAPSGSSKVPGKESTTAIVAQKDDGAAEIPATELRVDAPPGSANASSTAQKEDKGTAIDVPTNAVADGKDSAPATGEMANPENAAPTIATVDTVKGTSSEKSAEPPVTPSVRGPQELVYRQFEKGWEKSLVAGDVITLVSPDVYQLSVPLQLETPLTIQGTESQRALLQISPSDGGELLRVMNCSLTLHHVDIYVDLTNAGPSAVDIFSIVASDLQFSDSSLTVIGQPGLPGEQVAIIKVAGSRPWDKLANGDEPRPLHVSLDHVFVRGPGAVIRCSSTQAECLVSDSMVAGTGPILHAYNTEPRQYSFQRLSLSIASSTLDIQQPAVTIDCRPFDLRPVPLDLRLNATVVSTLTSTPSPSPLIHWASPTGASEVADTVRFSGSDNIYVRRENGITAHFRDGDIRTLVQVPEDWKRQGLGEDIRSLFYTGKADTTTESWELRKPRDLELGASAKRAVSQQKFESAPGAVLREIQIPRKLN